MGAGISSGGVPSVYPHLQKDSPLPGEVPVLLLPWFSQERRRGDGRDGGREMREGRGDPISSPGPGFHGTGPSSYLPVLNWERVDLDEIQGG